MKNYSFSYVKLLFCFPLEVLNLNKIFPRIHLHIMCSKHVECTIDIPDLYCCFEIDMTVKSDYHSLEVNFFVLLNHTFNFFL